MSAPSSETTLTKDQVIKELQKLENDGYHFDLLGENPPHSKESFGWNNFKVLHGLATGEYKTFTAAADTIERSTSRVCGIQKAELRKWRHPLRYGNLFYLTFHNERNTLKDISIELRWDSNTPTVRVNTWPEAVAFIDSYLQTNFGVRLKITLHKEIDSTVYEEVRARASLRENRYADMFIDFISGVDVSVLTGKYRIPKDRIQKIILRKVEENNLDAKHKGLVGIRYNGGLYRENDEWYQKYTVAWDKREAIVPLYMSIQEAAIYAALVNKLIGQLPPYINPKEVYELTLQGIGRYEPIITVRHVGAALVARHKTEDEKDLLLLCMLAEKMKVSSNNLFGYGEFRVLDVKKLTT